MFTAVKRVVFNAKFRKANRHYQSDPVVGERAHIRREGKESMEALFYYPITKGNRPVFVQVHGGAWVGMDAVDDDHYCERLSKELDALVVNLNYKRLYEKPFPYQVEETVDLVTWLIQNAEQLEIDKNKIVISGGSAGGNISAGAAVVLAQKGITIAGQILEVPFLDFTKTIPVDFPEGDKLFKLMFELYPPKLPPDSEILSPAAKATDKTLSLLAPAVIIVCGRDPLHTQGEYYANRLKAAGKLVDIRMYETGYHGFGTENAEEKPHQAQLREDCFWYKVEQARRLYEMKGD